MIICFQRKFSSILHPNFRGSNSEFCHSTAGADSRVGKESSQRFKFHNHGEFLDESKTGVTAGVTVVSFTGSNARLA